jgi:hypothetical protein
MAQLPERFNVNTAILCFLRLTINSFVQTELKELFDKFCVVQGHSDLQKGSRQYTMDKYEWMECCIYLDLLTSSLTEKFKELILTKQEAVELFLESKRKTVSYSSSSSLASRCVSCV